MPLLMPLLAGLVFGLGLIISGMSDPSKVLGFLDLAGAWDPSLALVMGGAVSLGALAFAWARRHSRSLTGRPMRLPTATRIDRRLVLGSLTFGIGWGLVGYCPGPALVSLSFGGKAPFVFVLAMLAGMAMFEGLERLRRRNAQA
jgi:uncharacterized membrane protein YedE/YeeE